MFNINILTLILSFPEGADILANTLDKSQSLPSGHSQRPHIIYKINAFFPNLCISYGNLRIFNLIYVPICIRIAVKDIVYVLVTPSFYILSITAIVIVIGTLFFVIIFFFHVVCFLILVQNYIIMPNSMFVLKINLDFI